MEESWDWMVPVIVIFVSGVLIGVLFGYLLAYVKYSKPKTLPRVPVQPAQVPVAARPPPRWRRGAPDVADRVPHVVPRIVSPRIIPAEIIITATGDKYHLEVQQEKARSVTPMLRTGVVACAFLNSYAESHDTGWNGLGMSG